jgi:cation transport ATPase
MSTTASAPTNIPPADQEQQPLSEPQRIINTYVAPTKTFTDIRRNASWWAPWLLGAIVAYLLVFAVGSKVGWQQVTENQMKMNPRQEARLEQLRQQNPDQYQRQVQLSVTITKGISYAVPFLALLIVAIVAAVLMATFNFGLGTQISFMQAMAIVFYGFLPGVIRSLLASITLFSGANTEGFNFSNPIGTNVAYYMSIADTPHWLYSLCSWIDLFTVWIFVLIGLGFAVVGRRKKSTGIAVLIVWYAVMVLVTTGLAAAFS